MNKIELLIYSFILLSFIIFSNGCSLISQAKSSLSENQIKSLANKGIKLADKGQTLRGWKLINEAALYYAISLDSSTYEKLQKKGMNAYLKRKLGLPQDSTVIALDREADIVLSNIRRKKDKWETFIFWKERGKPKIARHELEPDEIVFAVKASKKYKDQLITLKYLLKNRQRTQFLTDLSIIKKEGNNWKKLWVLSKDQALKQSIGKAINARELPIGGGYYSLGEIRDINGDNLNEIKLSYYPFIDFVSESFVGPNVKYEIIMSRKSEGFVLSSFSSKPSAYKTLVKTINYVRNNKLKDALKYADRKIVDRLIQYGFNAKAKLLIATDDSENSFKVMNLQNYETYRITTLRANKNIWKIANITLFSK